MNARSRAPAWIDALTAALSVTQLHVLNVDPYAAMVAPTMRYLLGSIGSNGPIVAFGCSNGNAPVGVALALSRSTDELEIVWLYVLASSRRRRAGSALLDAVERHAAQRSRPLVRLVYPTASAVPMQNFLAHRGWTIDAARFIICALRAASVARTPWFARWEDTKAFDLFAWNEINEDERRVLQSALVDGAALGAIPSPLDREEGMDPRTSFGMRRAGQVVGWCITHPAGPQTLQYSLLGVLPSLRGQGTAFAMVSAAVRRQLEAYGNDALGTLCASTSNLAMMKLIAGGFSPHVAWKREVSAATKRLAP